MFIKLYGSFDRNDLLSAGMWFDPHNAEIVEVTDLQRSMGEIGATLIERGRLDISEKTLKDAIENAGLFHEEKPPEPPKGRKRWSPRTWSPPVKPGYLFWMPEEPIAGFKILDAWREWADLINRGGNFQELSMETRQRVILGAELLMRHSGMYVVDSATVIRKTNPKDRDKRGLANAILTMNPQKEIRTVLENMGVSLDD